MRRRSPSARRSSRALTPSADAQTFNDVFVQTLNGSCQGLQGPTGSGHGGVLPAAYGPRLAAICAGSGGVSQGTGALSIDTRGGAGEEQRVPKRLKERRDGQAASADMGAGLSLFLSGDYQAFDKGAARKFVIDPHGMIAA